MKNEYIVIGAHYDHLGWSGEENDMTVYNGADDNASGVAAIIEFGKKLSQNADKLKRSFIIVAFDAEESGLCGSTRILADSLLDIAQVKCMMSIDMVGMYAKNGKLELGGINSMENAKEIVNKTLSSNDIKIGNLNDKICQRTDTGPFGSAGIPAFYVNTGLKSPYHKPEDDSNLLDYEGMEKICNFISDLSLNLSQEENIIPSKSLTVTDEARNYKKIVPGFQLSLGSSNHIQR